MSGVTSTELPHLTAANFQYTLASDVLLAHYFNDFLSLPPFTESLLYNQDTGLFEVGNGAAEVVSRRIRSILHHSKSQRLTGDPTVLARTPPVDNHYSVHCLDREQGIQWIMKERFPFFLQSDCYSEYRLARLFLQHQILISGQIATSAPQLHLSSQSDKGNNTPTDLACSPSQKNLPAKPGSIRTHVTYLPSGQKEHIDTKFCESPRCFPSLPLTENPSKVLSLSFSSDLKSEKTQELQISHTAPSTGNAVDEHLKESVSQSYESSEEELQHVAAEVVKQVVNNALKLMDGQTQANTSDCLGTSGNQTDCASTDGSFGSKVYRRWADGARGRLEGEKEKVQEGMNASGAEEKTKMFKKNWERLDKFKEFLRGKAGEKVLNLWLDIERLKATQSRERKNRYLVLMSCWYLHSSSHSCLNVELLSSLGLAISPCWTEEKLRSVQHHFTVSLVTYWAPRFWTSQHTQEDRDDSHYAGLRCVSPPSGIQSHPGSITLPLLHPDNQPSQCSPTLHRQSYCSCSQSDASRGADRMLQALSVDSRAGLYLTTYCEQSGNQLWENAVHFWTELQRFRELFHQDGPDPYRVQREAQLLYTTYLDSSARRSIGVDEEIRREVYMRMKPAFERLFDRVEEHTVTILLEPWTLLVLRDKESFQKVCVREEVRRLNSQEYRELQSLHEESGGRPKQAEQGGSVTSPSSDAPSTPPSKGPQDSDSWSKVSPKYQGYVLGSLLRHRHEIRHFMSFLKEHDAGVHLTCWSDLEQYRKMSQRNTAVRQERSSRIVTRYLSEKYFFGSDSPATTEQQNNILCLAGGLERLKQECLSKAVVMEIQNIVKSHIEKKWLPEFLSTAEFRERRKHQPKDEGWRATSQEEMQLRRILRNPVTCVQFQYFLCAKGGFLENDLLFWLEVQRYKDLCHYYIDEASIQQKISIIINRFINFSTRPALRIDIPPEQAQHILEKRHELGRYIFREAQISVFGELLKFWPEFQELSSSIQEEQLLPLLQERRDKYIARVRRQKRKEEEKERSAQAGGERLEPSFGDEEETDDVDNEEGKTPKHPMSWSYSKYMAALDREEALLRRQSQLDTSSSTSSDSYCSVQSSPSSAAGGRESAT